MSSPGRTYSRMPVLNIIGRKCISILGIVKISGGAENTSLYSLYLLYSRVVMKNIYRASGATGKTQRT